MNLPDLFDIAWKAVANMIRGQPPEEIRKILQVKNDFTLKEEAGIRIENAWMEDC